jgi:hypothetical protein
MPAKLWQNRVGRFRKLSEGLPLGSRFKPRAGMSYGLALPRFERATSNPSSRRGPLGASRGESKRSCAFCGVWLAALPRVKTFTRQRTPGEIARASRDRS